MTPDKLTARPIFEFSSVVLAEHLNACFDGYVVPFVIEPAQFDSRFRPEDLDTTASQLWFFEDEPAAISLIARRGWTCRLAAMAVAPRARRKGVGLKVMKDVIHDAIQRRDRRFVLEVIEQNPPAIALYERVGFKISRRLAGYVRSPRPGTGRELIEVDPLTISRLITQECDLDLAWDYHPETLAAKSPPTLGLSLGDKSFAIVSDTPGDKVVLWALLTKMLDRSQGFASQLVEALGDRYQGKTIMTPVAVPDQLAPGFFEKNGFVESEISQFEMVLDLTSEN